MVGGRFLDALLYVSGNLLYVMSAFCTNFELKYLCPGMTYFNVNDGIIKTKHLNCINFKRQDGNLFYLRALDF